LSSTKRSAAQEHLHQLIAILSTEDNNDNDDDNNHNNNNNNNTTTTTTTTTHCTCQLRSHCQYIVVWLCVLFHTTTQGNVSPHTNSINESHLPASDHD
jgi:hypothetical protein